MRNSLHSALLFIVTLITQFTIDNTCFTNYQRKNQNQIKGQTLKKTN